MSNLKNNTERKGRGVCVCARVCVARAHTYTRSLFHKPITHAYITHLSVLDPGYNLGATGSKHKGLLEITAFTQTVEGSSRHSYHAE